MVTPSRISLARRRRGMKATRLAELVGVSAQSMYNYEGGRVSPGEEVLERIADVLAFPAGFFVAPDVDEVPEEAVTFRARTKLAAAKRDAALGAGSLAVTLAEWIDQRFQLPTPDVPTLDALEPEVAAEIVRARWGLGAQPISHMIHLMEAHGVRVFSLAPEYAEVDAFSFWRDQRPFVFLNTMKTGERGRFDAAHELGHLVLHGQSRSLTSAQAEKEANAFASAFLMPKASVLGHLPKTPDVQQILRAKQIWKVAAMALAYRLHELGMLGDWQYRETCVVLSQGGYRREEPGGIARETSQVLNKVITALRRRGTTPRDIASDLHLTTEDLNGYMFGLVVTALSGEGPASIHNRPALTVARAR